MEFNDYFQNMLHQLEEFYDKLNKAEEEKDDAVARFGDSDEVDIYFEKCKEVRAQKPYSDGQLQALHLVERSNGDELVLNDFVWEDDIHDFIQTLRDGGVKEFVLANKSTSLMVDIHGFVNEGCTLSGLYKATKKGYFGDEEVIGLTFKINGGEE